MPAQHQPGIVADPGPASRFVILAVHDLPKAVAVLSRAQAVTSAVASLAPDARLTCTVGLSSAVMAKLTCGVPAELTAFVTLSDGTRAMPSTQADAILHVNGARPDLCFELARRLRDQLGEAVAVVEEIDGFRYLDQRDLTGFIDGTENPDVGERAEVAVVGQEDAPFAGGSYMMVQRYEHHLDRWADMSDAEQEQVIGRTKPDSVERDDKPATAHISRVVIEEDGQELEIVRHSMPYGDSDVHGLLFLAYCRTPSTFSKMMQRMVGGAGDGLHDHLLDFVTPRTGHFFFAPGPELLADLSVA